MHGVASSFRPAARPMLAALLMLALVAGPLRAQEAVTPPPVAAGIILTLDQDRLFAESAFGRASLAREAEAARLLGAENTRIEDELAAEEQNLTTRRGTLPAAEFAALATAFDEKVVRIRAEQDAKVRDLTRAGGEDRKAFLRAVVPVLGELMGEKGAVAILDKSTVILALSALDVTEEAIGRVDAVLKAGPVPPTEP
jgi:Skp family chaperone for outer membrane proteins